MYPYRIHEERIQQQYSISSTNKHIDVEIHNILFLIHNPLYMLLHGQRFVDTGPSHRYVFLNIPFHIYYLFI